MQQFAPEPAAAADTSPKRQRGAFGDRNPRSRFGLVCAFEHGGDGSGTYGPEAHARGH